ncbi:peroxiredoxin [Candidatus Anaplasma sp. TIGMIC]|uniref:peroxiredoxin n=1 Tax=Candidatus Anaplasma sp. TIGMIC TaxID=3020713 RepID=UPI00232C2529|nr:peroxiredoxin [Candidatus Anaplasma sp. TIGMIC]MDB1135596.1 peroxiredoxin [Candidatus Anaplasma sp. TIGMIC]
MTVKEGDLAPGFSKDDGHDCGKVLSSYFGSKNVVLYFYPKDDTPGCTKEAENFRDMYPEFVGLNTAIVGVSKDSISSHENFKKKYDLPFELIADTEATLAKAYGVWVEKSMFGKSYMGIERSTFLVDSSGSIRKIWRNVKVHGHADEVFRAVKDL